MYWATESYTHWIAARAHLGRDLTGPERREVLVDGLPLVAACGVPALVLVAEGVLGVEARTGILLALVVNVGLLVRVGWTMATSGGLRGWRRGSAATGTGLLGVLMIALKLALHRPRRRVAGAGTRGATWARTCRRGASVRPPAVRCGPPCRAVRWPTRA
ncbi:hypothetical protein [Cellulomonas oligotrophica]|uniref:Uncharacterized protein n=1 Tax=Cellulomonas oligotrophica TaxID=931536 RepID=A0A7Y9FGZ5_9CELL|nr:hypothetical protein [Cellulomonas oligotrophica]NYD87013.1 hypothetical protein [Cellulomonas oligotrophica]GIG32201.1 hypothetical protein Col01nite_13600 [Cellulomonas oligotrophica]